jgi:hypothetical protein
MLMLVLRVLMLMPQQRSRLVMGRHFVVTAWGRRLLAPQVLRGGRCQ